MKTFVNQFKKFLLISCCFINFKGYSQNPIFKDAFTADPSPLVYNGRLYVYVGQDEAKDGELFTMTGWRCYSTTDMKTWTSHGVIMKPTDFSWGAADAWAAQVVERNGKFYLYVTVTGKNPYGGRNIGVAVSNSPTGPFVDAKGTPLIRDNMTNNGKTWDDIDPTVMIDDDGQAYLCWGNPICYLVKLKANMTEIDGTISQITPPNYAEGPWLYKRNSLYYLAYPAFVPGVGSEQICYATATNVTGPWTYRGVLSGTAKNSYTIHPGIVEYKGQNYFFYHNATLTLNGQGPATGRRSVCVEYMCYNTDGTIKPITQTTAGITVASPCPPVVTVTQAPYNGIVHPIPCVIQIEEYDVGGNGVSYLDNTSGSAVTPILNFRTDEDVDIETCTDVGGGYNLGYATAGEWLEYSVNVVADGNYDVDFRVACDGAGRTVSVSMDGSTIANNVAIPNTGAWQTWQTVTVKNIPLTAGKKVMRLTIGSTDYVNVNFVEFKKSLVTGVENSSGNKFEIFPNPFDSEGLSLNIDGDYSYKISDMTGLIHEQGKGNGAAQIGHNLLSGIFLLTIEDENGVYIQKIIKQ
jgi:Glycosyl hydrolases family 43/Carbohydrate binding module (family 6)